jgi:hypothetical protein
MKRLHLPAFYKLLRARLLPARYGRGWLWWGTIVVPLHMVFLAIAIYVPEERLSLPDRVRIHQFLTFQLLAVVGGFASVGLAYELTARGIRGALWNFNCLPNIRFSASCSARPSQPPAHCTSLRS